MTSSLRNGGMLEVCPGLMNFFKVFHQFLELMLSNLSFCVSFSVSCAFAFLIAVVTLFRVCL